MSRIDFNEIDKITINRYQAVLIAAQRARHINARRLTLLEKMVEESVEIDGRKVTSIAMNELADGKVKFDAKKDTKE